MPETDPKSAKAAKRRKLYGATLLAAIALFQANAAGLLTALSHEEITAEAWAASYVEILIDMHAQASHAGRAVGATLVGLSTPIAGLADQTLAVITVAGQAPHVADFRRDIEEGRYNDPESGELDPDRCLHRVDLYANRAHGTAHEACVSMLGLEDEIFWRLSDGSDEKHCKTCPQWAGDGPYSRFSLPAVPGDGRSTCGTNCLCHLEINEIPIPMLARPRAYVA